MKINKSPWIHQLDHNRKSISVASDLDTDVVIIGAGIAGVSTAFFTLKYTTQRVVVVDQGRLAHGATGHNAGQIVARFERPLEDIVKEFGFEMTRDALVDMESTWKLIEEMYNDSDLDIVFSRTTARIGFITLNQIITALKDFEIEVRSGITGNLFLINKDSPFVGDIPKVFEKLYKLVPHSEILSKLETEDTSFQAVYLDKAACVNSALFCQEVVAFLLEKYSDRFSLYENTHIKRVVLKNNNVLLDAGKYTMNASKVVLCTNGFENFDIFNEGGLAIDKKFHHSIRGTVGYMSGYLEKLNKEPVAIAYLNDKYDQYNPEDYYLYLTRRPHEYGDETHNLVCMGGPEVSIEDRAEYMRDYDYPEDIQSEIDNAIKREYDSDPNHKIDYEFTWHGLMGYTPNRIRVIGEEPKNKVLLYNLGCNGIGIIPSILGGRRISKILNREKVKPSIFDPRS
jgi:glycine/D-amino acid oxidase-like deaminating enzyme